MANGMLSQLQGGAPAPGGPAPGGPAPGGPAPGGPAPGGPQAGGDLEAQFNQAAQKASQILYDKKVFDNLTKAAKSSPVAALSNTVVMILTQIDKQIPNLAIDTLFGVGMTLIVDAADVLQQGGIEVTEDMVTQAMELAVQDFLTQNPKRFSPQEIQSAVQRLEQGLQEMPTEAGMGQAPGQDTGQPPAPTGGALNQAAGGM